jgi:hypothetical protein
VDVIIGVSGHIVLLCQVIQVTRAGLACQETIDALGSRMYNTAQSPDEAASVALI